MPGGVLKTVEGRLSFLLLSLTAKGKLKGSSLDITWARD